MNSVFSEYLKLSLGMSSHYLASNTTGQYIDSPFTLGANDFMYVEPSHTDDFMNSAILSAEQLPAGFWEQMNNLPPTRSDN